MTSLRTSLFLAAALLVAFTTPLFAGAAEEIEGLLAYVAKLEGAKFVRNGDAHSPADAVAHMRLKWSKQKGRIQSAEDFIEHCASKSTVSGKPYRIRFADGREEEAGKVLHAELARMRMPSRAPM